MPDQGRHRPAAIASAAGPRIGCGCWQIGGPTLTASAQTGWGPTDDEESARALQRALAGGIRFFDTAPSYGWGRSERLLGDVLSSSATSDVAVCTKFGPVMGAADLLIHDYSEAALRASVEASRERLRRRRLDMLLLHSPPDDFPWADYPKAPFERLVAEGLIGAYGVSVRSLRGARAVLAAGFGTCIEAIYNMLDRRAEADVLPECGRRGWRFIARVPLASGFLSGGIDRHAEFPIDDIRARMPAVEREWRLRSAAALMFLDECPGGLAVSALRFVLSHPDVSVVIPGLRRVAHVEQALEAQELGPLPTDVTVKIREAVPEVYDGWR